MLLKALDRVGGEGWGYGYGI